MIDLLDLVRSIAAAADRAAENKNYPVPCGPASPLLAIVRQACVERGYTAGGLAVQGLTAGTAAGTSLQVVADEWTEFVTWASAEGLIRESFGIRSTSSMCDVALKAWKAGRAALAAAPVQAQEPVGEVTRISEDGSMAYVNLFTNDLTVGSSVYSAPVQPVAVPDGWKLVPIEPTERMICAGIEAYQGKCEESYVAMLAAAPAAPAAQGDTADAGAVRVGSAASLIGEEIFNLATPHFLWTKDGAACDGWQHATAGVVGMPSLLSFARSLAAAAIAASKAAGSAP